MIAIIDYGMGNIHSIKKALENCGARAVVTSDPRDIARCDKLVLPGVGAFRDAMRALNSRRLSEAIAAYAAAGKPLLGICLGMQLLFESSQEAVGVRGLGILKGRVRKFALRRGFPVPHMGWNSLKIRSKVEGRRSKECLLLRGIADGSYVYFCHSYYPVPKDKKVAAASCAYADEFSAVVWRGNIYGTQFHPEKSQAAGLLMVKNFVERC